MFVDSHCHLDDPVFSQRLGEVLAAAMRAGVTRYVVPGVSPDAWDAIARLAGEKQGVFSAFGLHPMLAGHHDTDMMKKLRTFAGGACAIGEIGLDYLVAAVPREIQQDAFRAQLLLAVEVGLPVVIHCRHAFQDLLRILREVNVQRVGGVVHAFSGSVETARECIRLGMAIGVAGTVTYHNAVRPVEVVRYIPLEHLLLETDAPDLTPEPYRGCANEPAFLPDIAGKVALIKGISQAEVARVTTANAERLFRI